MMKIYLIAEKLSHSFSPRIHSLLADYSYELCELSKNDLEDFFTKRDFDGLNVTIPYKTEVIKYLDRLSEAAAETGAVNTVVNRDNVLTGYNTDLYGFMYAVKRSGADVFGKKAVVIGSGGASKTVCAALKKMGAHVRVLTHKLNNPEGISSFYDAQLIVNTSPVGMYPENGKAPIELDKFSECEGVIDLIYNPSRTALLSAARERGIKTENGLSMLAAQAKRACEIFTGKKIDESVTEKIRREIENETLNIVLIGMPGAGKSTVGREIAQKLGREFIDCDEYLKSCGTDPARTIELFGEAAFRQAEAKALGELCKRSGAVIATGGGAVTLPENKHVLAQNGFVVYLSRETNKLETTGRPLSQKNTAERLLSERLPLYRAFCDTEAANDASQSEVAEKIIDKFYGRV